MSEVVKCKNCARLKLENARLKRQIKDLKEKCKEVEEHNAKLVNCVDRYHAFMGVHSDESIGR